MKHERRFKRAPETVAQTRRFVRHELQDLSPELLDDVILMTSELAANAVLHGRTDYVVRVRRSRSHVTVTVTDQGGGTPTRKSPGAVEPSGRGILIIDTLSDAWGTATTASGQTEVWFTVNHGADEGTFGARVRSAFAMLKRFVPRQKNTSERKRAVARSVRQDHHVPVTCTCGSAARPSFA